MSKLKSAALSFSKTLPHIGFYNAVKISIASLFPGEYKIRLRGYRGTLNVRGATTDIHAFRNFFGRVIRTHDFGAPRTIIDAGANVGYFSLVMARAFPEAVILAIEPEARNFEILSRNAAPYPNIKPIRAALWPRSESVRITNPDAASDLFKVESRSSNAVDPTGEIPGLTVDELLDTHGITTLDLLKVDIEGGEKYLFAENIGWLSRVDQLLIEVHGDAWRSVFEAVAPIDYTCREVSCAGLLFSLRNGGTSTS